MNPTTATTRRERPFTVLDAMVLSGATAPACLLARPYVFGSGPGNRDGLIAVFSEAPDDWLEAVDTAAYYLFKMTLPFAAGLSLALFALMLLPPRPPWRRLRRRPGFVAGAAAALTVAIGTLLLGPFRLMPHLLGVTLEVDGVLMIWSVIALHPIGPAVAVSWSTLALTGRWRPSPTWADRLGRLLGVYWLIEIPFGHYWNVSNWI